MFTTRDVIKDALNRTGVWTNSTSPIPDNYINSALRRLAGILADFNNKNFLTFLQRKVKFVAKETLTIGVDDAGRGVANDVPVPGRIAHVSRCYWAVGQTEANSVNQLLEGVPFADFEMYGSGAPVFTFRELNDLQLELTFKQAYFGKPIILHYNEGIDVKLNSEWAMPDSMRELWTVALCVALLDEYPRPDDSLKASMSAELERIVSSVGGKNAASRVNLFNSGAAGMSYARFMSGIDIYGG